MNISTCEIILKIAEFKNLARTAEHFSYTPSRISQILKAVETEMGIALFHRGKTGLVPTAECEALLPHMRELLNSETFLQEKLDQLKNIQAGAIRIGSLSSMSCHWLPQRLKAFGAAYPRIRFELKLGDSGQIAEWTQNGLVDIGLVDLDFVSESQAGSLQFIPLMEDPFFVLMEQDHPLAGRGALSWEQLREESFIFLEPEDNRSVDDYLHRAGFQPHVQYRVKDDYTIMALVENGLGISILPSLILNRTPYRVCAAELDPPYRRHIGIILPKEGHVSAATLRLLDFCLEETAAEG